MTGKSDQEFEDYLDGNSEISQLYAQSKSINTPEKLGNTVKAMARGRTTVSPISQAKKKPQQKIILPFAMAATVVLAIGIYWVIAPQNSNQQKAMSELASLDKSTLHNIKEKRQTEHSDIQPLAENNDSLVGTPNQNNESISSTKTVDTQLAINQAPSKTQKQPVKEPSVNIAKVDNVEQSSTSSSAPVTSDDELNTDSKLLALDDASKNESEALKDALEEVDEDTDFSLNWMNRLAIKKTDTTSATKTVSSSLSPDKWVEEISLLHRQAKHKEAKKSLSEFRKLYPRYKLPAVLQEAYEPQ